jgi:uncharacterized protein (DUF427 family)
LLTAMVAGGQTDDNAAWYYPEPLLKASQIEDHIAFWHNVKVVADNG